MEESVLTNIASIDISNRKFITQTQIFYVSQPLTMIVNSSLRKGVFPDICKVAKVTPIFKSGSRSDANNYRPISVVSAFPRILERIVHYQVYEHLKATKALIMSPSAFQKCWSTITSLIDSTDK